MRKSRALLFEQKPVIADEGEVDDLLKIALRTRASVAQTSGDEVNVRFYMHSAYVLFVIRCFALAPTLKFR